jgi:hypothetical protein
VIPVHTTAPRRFQKGLLAGTVAHVPEVGVPFTIP